MSYITTADNFIIKPLENGATMSIPMDEQNSDYQEYLAWLAAGNHPVAQTEDQ